jgi:hypothetical protein
MARRLTSLGITAVALADMGANYDPETGEGAHILLYKRADNGGIAEPYWKRSFAKERRAELAREGKAIPVKDDDGNIVDGRYPIETAQDLKNAIEAYGRGDPDDKGAIQAHIKRQAKRLGQTDVLPDEWTEKSVSDSVIRRLATSFGKALGLAEDQVEKAWDEASTFSDELAARRVREELWQYFDALQTSLIGTITDTEEPNRDAMVRTSLSQFMAAITAALPTWLAGQPVDKAGRKISAERRRRLESMRADLDALLTETDPAPKDDDDQEETTEKSKDGKESDMGDAPSTTIDKSALADDVRAHLEALEKRASDAEARVTQLEADLKKADDSDQPTDPFEKAMADPAVPEPMKVAMRAEREARVAAEKQAADEAEISKREREERATASYIAKAQAFEALPVKPEEFGPVLKTLAESAPEQFAEIERVLRAADEQLRQSELFKEKGRAGVGAGVGAYAEAQAKAEELRKSDPDLTAEQAFAKVWEDNPELRERHRTEQRA